MAKPDKAVNFLPLTSPLSPPRFPSDISIISSFPSQKLLRPVENWPLNTMGVRDSHGEPTGTPDPVEKGFATLNTIRYVAETPSNNYRGFL